MNQKRDAINIAPFVDILLVLFVILIVTSNFADVADVADVNVTEQKIKIKELTNLLSEKELLIKELIDKTTNLEKALKSKNVGYSQLSDKLSTLKQKNKTLLSKLQLKNDQKSYKSRILRLNETIKRLEKENQKLKEEKEKAMTAGLPITIGVDGNFYIGKSKIGKYKLYRFIKDYKIPFTVYSFKSSKNSMKKYQEFKIWYETTTGGKLQ